jgi:hypothetical protein
MEERGYSVLQLLYPVRSKYALLKNNTTVIAFIYAVLQTLICITLLSQIWSRIILDSRIRIGIIFGSQIRIRIKVKRGIQIHALK